MVPGSGSALVDLIRDFLAAYLRLRALFDRYRAGELHFEDVPSLVGDDRESLLFRLKERSHALYRMAGGSGSLPRPRQALFDLAVGSLFHEAMKLRENLYQTEVYAPKVRELQRSAAGDAGELFRDFEKILSVAGARLAEALSEAEELLEHTRAQFRSLLADYRGDPLIARTLLSEHLQVAQAFPEGLDAIFSEIWGDAATGYAAAARSYLESAYFEEAIAAITEARKRTATGEELDRLESYAEGMRAFQSGDYRRCIDRLDSWISGGIGPEDAAFIRLASSAVSRIDALVSPEDRPELPRAAAELAKRMLPLAGPPGERDRLPDL